ncbi:MAG: protein translocase subunit SecF [Parcubacteria group bacterium]|nr:protein translocase subunit SecF [Parcubacteria group bacterium]
MYIPFVKYKKVFYGISIALVLLSIASMIVFGLKPGIEFSGGSALELTFEEQVPDFDEIRGALQEIDLGEISLQKTGTNSIILKMKFIDEETHQDVLLAIKGVGEVQQGSEGFQVIGPVIGEELKRKTKIVVILALICILIYIAFSFRKISRPVNSWVYGLSGLIALCHDVLIPLGVFAVLGKFYGVEITIPIITAFLTVFGYSINDSVVVFDRVRENLLKDTGTDFNGIVEKSLNQTLTRSINTSFTTLLALFAIFFLGGETLRYFSFALILGIGLGTYSSLFLATPLLTTFLWLKDKRRSR